MAGSTALGNAAAGKGAHSCIGIAGRPSTAAARRPLGRALLSGTALTGALAGAVLFAGPADAANFLVSNTNDVGAARSAMPVFEALPGASFIVNGATPAKNSALTSAGAELRLMNGVSVLAKFDGEFATHSQTYAGTGTVRYTW